MTGVEFDTPVTAPSAKTTWVFITAIVVAFLMVGGVLGVLGHLRHHASVSAPSVRVEVSTPTTFAPITLTPTDAYNDMVGMFNQVNGDVQSGQYGNARQDANLGMNAARSFEDIMGVTIAEAQTGGGVDNGIASEWFSSYIHFLSDVADGNFALVPSDASVVISLGNTYAQTYGLNLVQEGN